VIAAQVEVIFLKQDISDIDAVSDVLSYLPEEARDVDILVNSAGLALGTAPAHEVDMAVRRPLLIGLGLLVGLYRPCIWSPRLWWSEWLHVLLCSAIRPRTGGNLILWNACQSSVQLQQHEQHEQHNRLSCSSTHHRLCCSHNALLPAQDVQTMMNTNVTGLIAMTRAIVPGMVARNSGAAMMRTNPHNSPWPQAPVLVPWLSRASRQ
jgi:NAD(P)-dependent dehydrogenase (short-subunit alcohol dehydrogenase family)